MSANQQTRNNKPRKPRSDFQRLSRRFMSGFLRSLFLLNKPARAGQSGFVLPTTVLLLLVLTLTVGALSFRTFSRSSNVIALREEQVVDSAAAPAVDRAKAKLEYLFTRDSRFPGGIPSSDVLASMMLNDGNNGIPAITANDPYVFPGETRVSINGDSTNDNAWSFPTDVDGNGSVEAGEVVVYSILMDDAKAASGSTSAVAMTDNLSDLKADALVVRNGPINTSEAQSGCGSETAPEAGWQVVNSTKLQKNFQVTAFVANRNTVNRTATAVELQQVRQADRGNKWGAWFKYDLELFPGADRNFFWNGAMHTEGSLLVQDKYKARMISSHNSCLYTQDSSEITLASTGSFQGQVLSAKSGTNDFGGTSSATESSTVGIPAFHQFKGDAQKPHVANSGTTIVTKIGTDTDSVTSDRQSLRGILLDPIKLFTEDVLAHRTASSSTGWSRDSAWANRSFVTTKRIYNENSATPYLDDTYRADNRYGPKAVYDKSNKIPSGSSVGSAITSNTALTALDTTNNLYGLDGYWERRAIGQGLRIIVGQRLELGNPFGWKGGYETTTPVDNTNKRDPLHPPSNSTSTEARQRKSLYDNLAAVQGMVVYHYAADSGQLPRACIAATAHPGTETTVVNSRTFNTMTIGSATKLNTDFFRGTGTNGWEFAFPYTTATDFATAIGSTQPLGKVLRNLGNFAGDPLGGAPSFVPTQDTDVHPAPNMAAWGDFSQLRRIFESGTAYANLSPADQSTLHSAACTVGMLAYALDNEIQSSAVTLSSLNSLGVQLEQLIDGVGSGGAGDINTYIGTNLPSSGGGANNIPVALRGQPVITSGAVSLTAWNDTIDNTNIASNPNARAGCTADVFGGTNRYNRACDAADYYLQFSKEDFYRVLLMQNSLGSTLIDRYVQATALLGRGSQFSRDRALGFKTGSMPTSPLSSNTLTWNTETGIVGTSVGGAQLITGCDPDIFSESTNANIGLALAFCVDVQKSPKYPALYYLFPYFTHDHNGKDDSSTAGNYVNHIQPPAEEYIADPYVTLKNTNGAENNYYAVSDANILTLATAFAPRATDFSNWVLPTSAATGALTDPNTQPFTINMGTSGRDVALLDKGMYDGREMLGLRMLDIDINKLSGTAVSSGGDRWISNTDGIVYAFREDAIREDAIVRPKDSSTTFTWANCDTWSEVYTDGGSSPFSVTGNSSNSGNCRLKKLTSATSPPFLQDPPLMTGTKISTKPIDFYADPDRRPHGFRLVNGATLNRATTVQSGMTFISDNMVYIKGDFNLHQAYSSTFDPTATNPCTGLIEEFTDKLISDACADRTQASPATDFYDARTVAERNEANFAKPAQDQWRPVEIVGDAVGVLSRTFKDGNIADGFTLVRVPSDTASTGTSSYQNQNRIDKNNPITWNINTAAIPTSFWKHADSSNLNTPILINRNGGLVKSDGNLIGNSEYLEFADSDFSNSRKGDLQNATNTIVNAVFISGIIPSQAGQTYGGMHNFPRFLENWDSKDLHISGGFFQLNFSTSATAPFDQDAWEPGANPVVGTAKVEFYGAPNRIWGYDIGLQYAPAGPIARRFVTVGRPRSEFYRELPVDDPYVKNLRCATSGSTRVFPNESC
jgi:hypothetical protein